MGTDGTDEGENEDEDDVVAVGNPEEGMAIEAEVAQGAAAEGDDEGDGEEDDEVHLFLVGAGDAVKGKGDDADKFDGLKHGGGWSTCGRKEVFNNSQVILIPRIRAQWYG